MKIIVIGAGIGGLSSYLVLRKLLGDLFPTLTIKLYESHSDPTLATSIVGGGLGLAPNGLRALSSFCPNAVERISTRGYTSRYQTMRNSTGKLLGHLWVGKHGQYDYPQMMLPRQTVHEEILAELPPNAVQWGRKVEAVRETMEGVEVVFEDGAVEKADLVIGADGVWSTVREAVVGDGHLATYEGLTGFGGFIPLSSLSSQLRESLTHDPVTLTFGPCGFFAYGPCAPLPLSDDLVVEQQIMWLSMYQMDSAPGRDMNLNDLRTRLLECYGSWTSPYDSVNARVFPSIIHLACGSELGESTLTAKDKDILVLPTYTISPRLSRWCTPSGKILLLGDAAHAMPPHSGQGVSVAVEDSITIALMLRYFLEQQQRASTTGDALDFTEVLQQAAKGYQDVQMPRVRSILDRAKHVGDAKRPMKWWEGLLRDWIFWIIGKLPESIVNDTILGYNVEAEVQKYLQKL